ncbi:MAG: O-antigen ligase family protein [Prevotellaceae bacterium]|jgi:hypothetical protein|nr:O-antigen ligase family protein [Prevotellaceae bacterium]
MYPVYLTYIFYSLLFLVSFAACKGTLNENIYIKEFAFGTVFATMIIVAIIQSIKHGKIQIRITWGDVFISGLVFIYMYFYIGTYNDLDFVLPLIYFLYYCFMRMQNTKGFQDTIHVLSHIVILVILLHLLFCILQLTGIIPSFHPYFPAGSAFGNPDMLGAYLAVLLPFCYISRIHKIFKFSVLFLGTVLLLLLQARTAIVATVITGILYMLLSGKINKRQFLKWLVLPFIVVVGLLIWWRPSSFGGRLFIWFTSLNMMIKKPAGWGLYAFEKHYPELQAEYVTSHDKISDIFNLDVEHSPFNEFLNIGVTLGIVGLLLFIAFVMYVLITAYKIRMPLLFPVCAFLTVSISYFPFKIAPLTIICITFMALIINSSQTKPLFTINIRQKAWLLVPLLFIVPVLTWNTWNKYSKWQMAVENAQVKEKWHIADACFSDVYPALKGNGRFLITMSKFRYQMGDTLTAFSLMKEAEQFFCDDVFLKNLALLYEQNGQITEAEILLHRAANIVPDRFTIAYERILFLQRTGKHQEAYDEAIKLYHKPVKSRRYADPFIIKTKLRTLIQSYSENNLIIQ